MIKTESHTKLNILNLSMFLGLKQIHSALAFDAVTHLYIFNHFLSSFPKCMPYPVRVRRPGQLSPVCPASRSGRCGICRTALCPFLGYCRLLEYYPWQWWRCRVGTCCPTLWEMAGMLLSSGQLQNAFQRQAQLAL